MSCRPGTIKSAKSWVEEAFQAAANDEEAVMAKFTQAANEKHKHVAQELGAAPSMGLDKNQELEQKADKRHHDAIKHKAVVLMANTQKAAAEAEAVQERKLETNQAMWKTEAFRNG